MQDVGANDLAIINPPEVFAVIQGERVDFHEYGFFEEIEIREHSQPFIQDLMQLIAADDLDIVATDLLVARHIKSVQVMIAVSASKPVEWVNKLNQQDGKRAYNAWWGCNGPFFVSCASDLVRSDLVKKVVAGLMCGLPLSQTDTPLAGLKPTPTDK